jgi:hypothetical protein
MKVMEGEIENGASKDVWKGAALYTRGRGCRFNYFRLKGWHGGEETVSLMPKTRPAAGHRAGRVL